MEVDLEHTVPSAEYLASTRLSIEEHLKPRLSKSNIRDASKGLQPPEKTLEDPNAPKDTGYFVLITLGLFGLVHILPLLFFNTANEYWMYKFRNTTTESMDADDRTYMQTYFTSLNALTVTTPGVVCNFIGVILGHKFKATTRIYWVLSLYSVTLLSQSVFVLINTDSWQFGFLIFTLATQLVLACAMALGGSGSMALIAKLPPKYLKAKLIGEGAAGLFSAVLRLFSIVAISSTTGSAMIYFTAGSILMIVTTIVFYLATKTKFFRYYTQGAEEDVKDKINNHKDIIEVFKIIWTMVFLNLFGMITPVGSIVALVVSQFNGTDNVWANKYFVTICTFLVPAFGNIIGRFLFNHIDINFSVPSLYAMVLSREAIFGTLLFLSNAKPRSHLPVIVNKDWEYALVVGGQSLTAGYLMNLTMVKTMRMVPPHRIELAMMVIMFFFSLFAAITSPLGLVAVSLL